MTELKKQVATKCAECGATLYPSSTAYGVCPSGAGLDRSAFCTEGKLIGWSMAEYKLARKEYWLQQFPLAHQVSMNHYKIHGRDGEFVKHGDKALRQMQATECSRTYALVGAEGKVWEFRRSDT